jgi:PPM family protein phosphatase
MKVSYCSKTDLGLKHPINSDALGDKKTKNGHVFVVADGSPVDANGSFASRLAVQSILDFFEKEIFENIFIGINHAFQFANEQVYRASILEEGLKGIFASLALVLVREEGVYYAHIGNARVYLKSEGVLKRLTTDHGYLDVQLYPSNDVDYSKPVVKLPKALGNTPSISPTVCLAKLDVAAGDVIFVSTHGISKVLDDNFINSKIDYASINSNILELVDAAKGKSAPENITLQLIAVTEGNIQKRMIPVTSVPHNRVEDKTVTTDAKVTEEQINLFNKISLDRKKTIKIGAAIIAVFLLIWFVFRQPHDDTDKVLDDAGEVITKDTTNQHQDLEELMEYEKPKKAEKEEEEEEVVEEEVVEEETSEEEPADVTAVDETTASKEETTSPKKEEKKKEDKKSEKESKKEDKKEKSGKSKSHTVKSGDTINALAIKYGVKAEAIRKANNISDDKIEIGQELKIPQ